MKPNPVNRYMTIPLLLVCGMLSAMTARAGWEPEIMQYKRGNEIVVWSSGPELMSIGDPSVGSTEPTGHVSNRYIDVRLRVDETIRDHYGFDWSLKLTYTIKFYDINEDFVSEMTNQTLSVDYKRTSGATVDRAYNRYLNRLHAKIYIDGIELSTDDGSGTNTYHTLASHDYESFLLEMVYAVERYRPLSGTPPDIAHDPTGENIGSPATNEVTLSWNSITGAETYDLEWIFIDVPPGTDFDEEPIEFDWRDAARINTADNTYRIALVYPRGIFVYRVRGIGKTFDTDLGKLINVYGNWSRSSSSYIDETETGSDYFFWNGFEPLINWTSAIDYAEEGKKKEIVSFYDGSGRMRQTVTMINTDNNAVVAETYYDHAGRAAVNSLPVPVKNGWIKYYESFNDDFDRDYFDEQAQLAVDGPDPMSTGATAAYYSPSNTFLGDSYHIGHIPNAEGYPYIQTRVLNDGTGRPHSTGGVGFTHRLKGGHETRYFYASPGGQEELDRLFGSEAGFVANYKKNMVVDANGQVSVSYLDGYGRTVATALAGDAADLENLHAIEAPAPETLTVSLLPNNTVQDNRSTVAKDFLVTVTGDYTFEYSLDPRDVDIPCWTGNDEKPCRFDLSIKIFQENEGELDLLDDLALTGVKEAVSETLTVTLDPGKYVVVKELSLSADTLQAHTDALRRFLMPNPDQIPGSVPGGCFDFTASVTPCLTCAQSCTTSYTVPLVLNNGTEITVYRNPVGQWYFPPSGYNGTTVTAFTISSSNPNVILDETESDNLQTALDVCLANCESTAVPGVIFDECKVMADVMVADMEPGGQYFDNKRSYDIMNALNDQASMDAYMADYLGNDVGEEENKYFWINIFIPQELQESMANMAGITWQDDDYDFWAELASLWNSKIVTHANYASLREQLLVLHPEYCTHYYFCRLPTGECCTNMDVRTDPWEILCDDLSPDNEATAYDNSNAYDIAMHGVNDFTEAVDGNWFNPLNLPDMYTLGLASTSDPVNQDPYFCPNGWAGQEGFTAMMLHRLMNFYPTPGDTSVKMSIYEVLTWDPQGYTPPGSPPAYHDDVLEFLHYLHGDGSTVVGILDDNYDQPGIDGFGNPKMSRWQYFRQTYAGLKKNIMKIAYTTWAKQNCDDEGAYRNFPLPDTQCGPSNPGGNLNCADDCYLVSWDENGDLQTDTGLFDPTGDDFDGFDARYQFFCIPQSIDELGDRFCENTADAYAYQWLNQMQHPYIGCVSADTTLAELLSLPANEGIREELLAYLRTYFLHACSLQTIPPPSGTAPADFDFATLSSPVAVGTLFPGPQFDWDIPSGLTHIDSPSDVMLIFMQEFEVNHGLIFVCPEDLFTPPMNISPTLEPGEAPEIYDMDEVACPCAKFAEWLMNTDGAFENGLDPEIFNPIRYEAYGEVDLSFLETAVIEDALNELEAGLGSSLEVENFIEYCRHPENYGQSDDNGFAPGEIPVIFRCNAFGNISEPMDCADLNEVNDNANNLNAYHSQVADHVNRFGGNYTNTCLQNIVARETFTMEYALNEYHYTLYYYDQAGNLIKTVPPAGVVTLDATDVALSMAHRQQNHTDSDYAYDGTGTPNTDFVWPEHMLVTNYRYNSNNQPIFQHTPDGGDSRFWYDKLGRMVLSQNAKQATVVNGKVSYSYTLYDELGRISEVGQLENKPFDHIPDDDLTSDPSALAAFIGAPANRKQVTRTYYDHPANTVIPGFVQKNVRNRVARTEYAENGGNAVNFVTYYSYDIHGNVNELIHQVTALQTFDRKFIRTSYEYDLVSGNVNRVTYQPNMPEMFIHKYGYDADNRITEVYTSRDNVIWDLDAKYFYYPHGPLARVEIGEKQVQGIDYAYTLHGWLKAVNGIRLSAGDNPAFDIGQDGMRGLAQLHSAFARDAYAFSLFYYRADPQNPNDHKDYDPIANTSVLVDRDINSRLDDNNGILGSGLFNGNIASMTTALRKPDESLAEALRKTYQYDQLNRIIQSNSFVADASSDDPFVQDDKYYTHYGYDPNGNIRTMVRRGHDGNLMDDLEYVYEYDLAGTYTNNRLSGINDDPGISGDYAGDIDDQDSHNYTYDAIGNLISDEAEEIDRIEWNVYGKVKSVKRASASTKPNLEFFYDPSGQRYAKVEKPLAGTAPQSDWKYTFYLRDAQGNPLCIYQADNPDNTSQYRLTATERPIYGSARIGLDQSPVKLGHSIAAPVFEVTLNPKKPDRLFSHTIMGPGTLSIGEGLIVRTNAYPNTYTPDDFIYYRSEGQAQVTLEKPAHFKNFVGEPGGTATIYKNGMAYTWNDITPYTYDGEWYLFGPAIDSVFAPSADPYAADSSIVNGGMIRTGPLTIHSDSTGSYAVAAGTTGAIGNALFPSAAMAQISVIIGNDEFVFEPSETDTAQAEDGTLTIRSSVFYTTNMRTDEFSEAIPDSIGYSFDESILILPGGQEMHTIFNAEIYQRDDSLEKNYTNSTLLTHNFVFRYWSATHADPVPPGLTILQQVDSVSIMAIMDRFSADSLEIVRNDTLFGGTATSALYVHDGFSLTTASVDIPGFGAMPYGVPYPLKWANLKAHNLPNDSATVRMYGGTLERDSSLGYVITLTGQIRHIEGRFDIKPEGSSVLAGSGFYGNVAGTLGFFGDSIAMAATDADLLVDDIHFDPVLAHAGIGCGLMDSIRSPYLDLMWLHPWSVDPLDAFPDVRLNGGTLIVTLDSVPPLMADTGHCNFGYHFAGGPYTEELGLEYVLLGNEVHVAFGLSDTLHLPFASTWRTQTGVYFRNPYLYSDSAGCHIESRDAVRYYAGLNLLELPYAGNGPGTADMLYFSSAPTAQFSAQSSTPSTAVPLATLRAVDSTGHLILEGRHAHVTEAGGALEFGIHPYSLAYLYLGTGTDGDTLHLLGHPAFLTHAEFRMGVGTFVFESPDTLFGIFPVGNLELHTTLSSMEIQGGTLMAMGTRRILRSMAIEGLELDGIPLMQVTAYRPRGAGMAERIISDAAFPETSFFDEGPDTDGWDDSFPLHQPKNLNLTLSQMKGISVHRFVAGQKIYELANHLGNVLVTISDRKLQGPEINDSVEYYLPDVLTMSDYDPFGMALYDRTENQAGSQYRHGFNSMERDNEIYGDNNAYDFGARIYDPRIGRWLATDLLAAEAPYNSPYTFSSNSPISLVDKDGKKEVYYVTVIDKEGNKQSFVVTNDKVIYGEYADMVNTHICLAPVGQNVPNHYRNNSKNTYDRYTAVTIDMNKETVTITEEKFVKRRSWMEEIMGGGIEVWGDGSGAEMGRKGQAWKIGEERMSIDLGSKEFEAVMFAVKNMKSKSGSNIPLDKGPKDKWVDEAASKAAKEGEKEKNDEPDGKFILSTGAKVTYHNEDSTEDKEIYESRGEKVIGREVYNK